MMKSSTMMIATKEIVRADPKSLKISLVTFS